jgi:hypothetical protein
MKKLSRRRFLEAGAGSSIAMIGGRAGAFPILQQLAEMQMQAPAVGVLEAHGRDLLHLAMDEIIPAGDGMPAASAVGGLDYLGKRAGSDAQAAKEMRGSLDALDELTQSRLKVSFLSLTHEQRVEVLTAFEKQDSSGFKALRDYVYEAYYTRPAVWKLIEYDFYPTNGPGPVVKKAFHDEALSDVRKKPKGYREVV